MNHFFQKSAFQSFFRKGAAFKRAMKKEEVCPVQAAAPRQALDSRKRIKAERCAPGCALKKREPRKPAKRREEDPNNFGRTG